MIRPIVCLVLLLSRLSFARCSHVTRSIARLLIEHAERPPLSPLSPLSPWAR